MKHPRNIKQRAAGVLLSLFLSVETIKYKELGIPTQPINIALLTLNSAISEITIDRNSKTNSSLRNFISRLTVVLPVGQGAIIGKASAPCRPSVFYLPL